MGDWACAAASSTASRRPRPSASRPCTTPMARRQRSLSSRWAWSTAVPTSRGCRSTRTRRRDAAAADDGAAGAREIRRRKYAGVVSYRLSLNMASLTLEQVAGKRKKLLVNMTAQMAGEVRKAVGARWQHADGGRGGADGQVDAAADLARTCSRRRHRPSTQTCASKTPSPRR